MYFCCCLSSLSLSLSLCADGHGQINSGTMPIVEAPRLNDRNVIYTHSNHSNYNGNRVPPMEYGVGLPLYQIPTPNMNGLSNVGYGAVHRSAFNVAGTVSVSYLQCVVSDVM